LAFLALDSITAVFETAPSISPWYPPPGLTLAVFLTFGLAYAPVTFTAVLISGLWIWQLEMPAPYLALLALTITAGYSAAAWILRSKLSIDRQLPSLQDFIVFVVVTASAAGLVAALSVAVFVMGGAISRSDYAPVALDFWVGDVIGVITLAPFLLAVGFPLVKGWVKRSPSTPCRPPTRGGDAQTTERDRTESQREAARQALRESEARYRTIYNTTPVMLHSIDREGRLLSVSDFWLETMGYARDEVIGRKSTEFLTEASRRYAEEVALPRYFKTGVARDTAYQFVKKNGEVIDVLLSAISERDETGAIDRSMAVLIDVTEQKRAEEAYRAVVDHSLQGLCILQEGRVVFANPALAKMFGYTVDALLAMPREEALGRLNPEGRTFIHEQKTARRTGHPLLNHYEIQVYTHGGDLRWTEQFVTTIQYHGQPALQIAVLDITERKKAQSQRESVLDALTKSRRQLEQLSRRLVQAQELERRALARELHDGIGQILTVIKLNLHSLEGRDLRDEEESGIEASLKIVDEAIEQVRRLSRDLRPSLLDNLGLAPALRSFVDQQAQHAPFKVSFSADAFDHRMPEVLENAYFRIAQEALTNVMRHAQASCVAVELREDDGALVLIVRDDGIGFDVNDTLDDVEAGRSLGLVSMRERAHLIGGTLALRSEPKRGTEICVRTPLSAG